MYNNTKIQMNNIEDHKYYRSDDGTYVLKRGSVMNMWELQIDGKSVDTSKYREEVAQRNNLNLLR